MKDDRSRRRLSALIGGGTGALLFALVAAVVNSDPGWLRTLDHDLGTGPQHLTADHDRVRELADLAARITHPDNLVAVVAVAAAVLALTGYWRAAVWSLIVIEAARWGYVFLKAAFDRPRPHWSDPVAHAGGTSFPSGHATVIGAAAGIAVVLAIMLSPTPALRLRLIGAALVVAALVGFDRILLGVHYPSDVLGGLLLGATITLLALAAFDPLPRTAGSHRATISP